MDWTTRILFLSTLTLAITLSGQSLSVIHEYKSSSDIVDVTVNYDSSGISPGLFISQTFISDVRTGKILKLPDKKVTVLSSKNQLLGVFSPGEKPANQTEPRTFQFDLFDASIHPRMTISDKFIDFGKDPLFFINSVKNAVLQVFPNGDRVSFYDNHGRLLRTKKYSQNMPHNYEDALIDFNITGNKLAFFTRVFDMESNQMIPMLYFMSPIGEEIWKTQPVLKLIDALTISGSGQMVAVTGQTFRPANPQSQNTIFVFDSIGQIHNSLPYRALRMVFNNTENRLLISEEQNVKIIDLNNDGIIFSKQACRGRQEIADIAFLNNSLFAVSLGTVRFKEGQQIFENPEIMIYSLSGDLIIRKEFPDIYSFHAKLLVNPISDQIGFCLQNKFVILQITLKD